MVNKKAQIVNTLTIVLAAIFLAGGVYLIAKDPTIIGSVAGFKPKINKDVTDKINENGEAKVIIYFKDNNIKTSSLESRRQKIKQNQDDVLSNLNYEDLRQKGKSKQASASNDLKLNHKYSTINAISGSLTQEGLIKLQNNPNIEKIALVKQVSIDLSDSVPLIEADKVWNQSINGINLTGQGQSICIIDTGVDYHHTALGNCSLTNVTQHKCKVIAGYDFATDPDDADPLDDHGHGTHVAGIAAGNGTGVIGVAKEARIVAIKALSASGGGDDADVAAGIDWCISNATNYNISVISMSLGDAPQIHPGVSPCPGSLDSPIEDAMQSAVAVNLTVFAASGNLGSVLGISYPACSPFAISVGATTKADAMWSDTNTHSLLDIVAPGASITSAAIGGGTTTSFGTSMATPHAAGVAAIMYQKEKLLNDRKPKQNQIEDLLKRSNISISDSGLSFPRINALQAVSYILKLNIADNSVESNNVKLKFTTATNIENASAAIVFSHNFISVNSSKYKEFNKSANITFFNLTFAATPVILRNGIPCSNCRVLNYDGENLTFNVSGFTNYTSAANVQLQIFDQTDAEGGLRIAKVGLKPIYFYANYSNTTSGLAISAGNCAINFTDMNKVMALNVSSDLFEFNRTFSSSNTYNYNITCNAVSYETLNLSDSIFVSPGCLDQTPNVNITITKNQKINCTDEIFRLRNQSVNVYGNLLINNTQIILEVTGGSNSINLFNRSNLTIIDSIINGSVNTYTIFSYNSSKTRITNSILSDVSLEAGSNSTIQIVNSTVSSEVELGGNTNNTFVNSVFSKIFNTIANSRTTIQDSDLLSDAIFTENSRTKISNSRLNRTFFRLSSYVEISNSNISNISQLGNSLVQTAIINFTRPRSTVVQIYEIRSSSKIYGYVDFPSNVTNYIAINVQRFYPVQVNFSDGAPAANKRLNITNSSGMLVFSKLTDSNGFVEAGNITFNQNTKFENFTFKINPTANISLLNDTPLIFTLSDTIPPAVSLIQPISSNEDAAVIYNATVTDDISINECRLYIDSTLNGSMTVAGSLANRTVTMLTPGLYSFLANCTDTSGNFNDTSVTSVTILDLPPPVILTINHSVKTNQSVRINWTTNITSNTTVNYGNTTALGTKSSLNNNIINHTRLITGLDDNTLYFYNVTSCNDQGCAANGTFNFTTDQNTASGGGSGGGGSSTVTCTSAWLCDAWSSCVNGQQSRGCEDLNGCSSPKTETQSCTVQVEKQGGHSGILEPIKRNEEPTTAAILETPKASMIKQTYMSLIWLIISLILLILFARRVDTFPLALWREEKYIQKGDVTRAERLFDRLISRFGRSKERERKYLEKVENVVGELEDLESKKPIEVQKKTPIVFKPAAEVIYKEANYENVLEEYKKTLNEYLALPNGERKNLEPRLSELKAKLVKLGKEDSQ